MKKGELSQRVFAGLFGGFLALALLKFGNPPIMEKFVEPPTNGYEFVLGFPWPISWAYALLFVVVVTGLLVGRWQTSLPKWLLVLPLAWLMWQFIAASRSVDPTLSTWTCKHFTACVLCFYLGLFALARIENLALFWIPLLVGFVLVLIGGWEQHFGGLEESRRHFFLYIYPSLKEVAPEYLKKIASNRIFSTLFYPNALAGMLLLLLPAMLALVWRASADRFTTGARWLLVGVVLIAALGCLLWSGSKGGWLLMLGLGLLTLLHLPLQRSLRIGIICLVLAGGLGGFFWRYAAFFEKGATSVSARFDYWHAATQTALDKPVVGTGPGTFAVPYQRLKRPESEMARLVHNDYLEQASDSGFPGLVSYTAFILFGLLYARVRTPLFPRGKEAPSSPEASVAALQQFAIWLGLVGWALQSFAEFGLYIPALAWPAFAFLGLRLGRVGQIGNVMDKGNSPR